MKQRSANHPGTCPSLRAVRRHWQAWIHAARTLLQASDGSALVEFAVCLPILSMLFVACVDYALMVQEEIQVQDAATAGAAYGAMPSNQSDLTGMQNAATNAAPGVSGFNAVASKIYSCSPGGTAVTSTTTCSGYGTPIEYVQVHTTATAPPLLAYSGISSLSLQGYATFRVMWSP